MNRSIMLKIMGYYLMWYVSVSFVELLMQHSECKSAYGIIVGFYNALIYSYFVKLNNIKVFFYSFLFLSIVLMFLTLLGISFPFYKDYPSGLSVESLIINIILAIFYNFPILIASILGKFQYKQ